MHWCVNAATHVLQFNAFYSNLKFGVTGFLFWAAVQQKAIAGVKYAILKILRRSWLLDS
jgi:hypothetical protein